jgi:hypothetical protein
MENGAFYIWNNESSMWTSNPKLRDQTEWVVWDPHVWWEFNTSLTYGVEFFPKAEIIRDYEPPKQFQLECNGRERKKVAILYYDDIKQFLVNGAEKHNDSHKNRDSFITDYNICWADFVIIYTTEPMQEWWPRIYGDLAKVLHHDKFKFICATRPNYTSPPIDRFFCKIKTFISMVVRANNFLNINQDTVPYRKYMFDVLMGGVKNARLYLLYKLLDSGFIDECLVNLHPSTVNWDLSEIQNIDPVGYKKYGIIDRYSSPSLFNLEEPIIQRFKIDAGDDPLRQVGTNLVKRPDFNLPHKETTMASLVPWSVYQSSWYSIVCETTDLYDSGGFLTEKIAKCLFAKRIFIMFNCPGLLRKLRQLGFKTFHGDIIDESYDDETDSAKRFTMAWEQVNRLRTAGEPRDVYKHFHDVLEHNHRLVMHLPDQQLLDIKEFIHKPFFPTY